MKCPSSFHRGQSKMDIQMTPMIDVVFLLLIYFVWSAGFMIVEKILPSNVSAAATSSTTALQTPPPEADFDNVVVRLSHTDGQLRWLLNEQSMDSLSQLSETLRRIATVKPDAPVILHPDANVPLGDVIDVYDAARQASIKKVQFAASSEKG